MKTRLREGPEEKSHARTVGVDAIWNSSDPKRHQQRQKKKRRTVNELRSHGVATTENDDNDKSPR